MPWQRKQFDSGENGTRPFHQLPALLFQGKKILGLKTCLVLLAGIIPRPLPFAPLRPVASVREEWNQRRAHPVSCPDGIPAGMGEMQVAIDDVRNVLGTDPGP